MDITTAIRSQMLCQLIAALGGENRAATTPASVSTPVAAQANLAAAALGQIFQATVLGNAGPDKIALQINGQTLTADARGAHLPDNARIPGAQLALKLETAGNTPRLSFVGVEALAVGKGQTGAVPPSAAAVGTILISPSLAARPALDVPPTQHDIRTGVIAAATQAAATRQGSAAPLYADLAALTDKSENLLPKGAADIARLLLANRLKGDAPITAADLKQALNFSGLFSDGQAGHSGTRPLDIKLLLTTLRTLLQGSQEQTVSTRPDAEPPRRDGALQPQRPALPVIGTESDAKTILATVGRETEQALERLKLHQIASLPDQRPAPGEQMRPQQINVELPIMLAQQTAMATFRLERDRRKSAQNGKAVDSWGVRFAIDADVLGPVHAHVRLAGQTISVSLWAEAPATHRAFVEAIPMLEATLKGNALEIGELAIFPGKPVEARASTAGHFLDRRS